MDSPSVRPSKSMYCILALMSSVTVTAIHLVGTSDTAKIVRELCLYVIYCQLLLGMLLSLLIQ
jgi:hypothetical protein